MSGAGFPYCPGCGEAKVLSDLCCRNCWKALPADLKRSIPINNWMRIQDRKRQILRWLEMKRSVTT